MATNQISFSPTDEQEVRIEKEAKRWSVNKSEIIRRALEVYFSREQRQANMDMITQEFFDVRYELARTRALLMRRIDYTGPRISETDLSVLVKEAAADAQAYLDKNKKDAA